MGCGVRVRAFFLILISPFLVLSRDGFAQTRSGAISGVVVETRTDQGGRRSLLLTIPSRVTGKVVDTVRVELPKDAAKQARPGKLPPGWTSRIDDRELDLAGPGLTEADRAYFRIDVGQAAAPGKIKIELLSSGERVLSDKIDVAARAPVAVKKSLDGILSLPPVVMPGERIDLGVLEPGITPPDGTWSISGVTAEVPAPKDAGPIPGQPTVPGGSTPQHIIVVLPVDLQPGDPVSVTYTDPWGETVVDAPSPEGCTVVYGPESPPAESRITGCTAMTFPGEIVCVCGWFPTRSAQHGVTLDGRPLGPPVSAAGAVVQMRLPADLSPGRHVLGGLESAGFPATDHAEITVLVVGGEIDRNKLFRGESTPLRLWIEGTEDVIELELTNHTPDIVSIDGGVTQTVATTGGRPNQLSRSVKGIAPGDFNITYRLSAGSCPCEGTAPASNDELAEPETPASRCGEFREDCVELERRATRAALDSAIAENAAVAAEARLGDAERAEEAAAGERETAATVRVSAEEYRQLARNAEEEATRDRQRAVENDDPSWLEKANSEEEAARQRHARADEFMSEAETAEERAREQVESASRLRRQAEEARRDADRKAELAAEALRAYEECIERLRECEGAAPPAPGTEAPPPGGESRPEEQPKICGPDITASVLRLLEKVMEDYYAASGEQRGRACWAAIDLATALDAWDIYPLDPSSAPPEEGPLPGQKYWFEHISNRCGVPRNPCGPTVEFLGLCMHSQVVNYLLWGVMNRLCEDENLGEVLHWGRTTLSFGGAHYTGQTVMREVGGEFVDVMRRLYDPANMPDRNSQEELDRLRDYALTLKIENLLQLEGPESDWPARAAAQCQLTCELTENEKAKLDSVRWDYRWKHLKTPPRGSRRK